MKALKIAIVPCWKASLLKQQVLLSMLATLLARERGALCWREGIVYLPRLRRKKRPFQREPVSVLALNQLNPKSLNHGYPKFGIP